MGNVIHLTPPIEGIFKPVMGEPMPLPYYSQLVSAGFPSPALDFAREELDLNRLVIKNPAATFLCRARGNSMTGVGIYDGSLLVLDNSRRAVPGDIVVVALDGDLTVKRFVREGEQHYLMAENPIYNPILVDDASTLDFFGVVIGYYTTAR